MPASRSSSRTPAPSGWCWPTPTSARPEGLAPPQLLHAPWDPPPDLAHLAEGLAFGLARNPPFVDGNRRTAAVACGVFILRNGARLAAEDHELHPLYVGLAEGTVTEAEFAAWLRQRLALAPTRRVQEPGSGAHG